MPSQPSSSQPSSSQPSSSHDPRAECAEVTELLPWWVNQTLEGEERRRVAEHLGSCLVCRRELSRLRPLVAASARHVPSRDLARHALGLPPAEWSASAIAEHLAGCGDCQGLFETVRGVEERACGHRVPSRRRPRRRRFGYHLAAAAVTLCVVGLGALQMRRDATPPLDRARLESAGAVPEVRPQDSTYLFAEGFESGDLSRWSLAVQGGDEDGSTTELQFGNS